MSKIEKRNSNISSPFGGQGAVFLIGFMGSGKTYWGKKWAELSGYKFIDIDDVIEEGMEKSIAQIFEEDGEQVFRDLETKVLTELPPDENIIVATGGGSPCFNDNISWMNKKGTTIYLRSSPKNILLRLENEKEKRPLIKHLDETEIEFYITEKIKEREMFYHQAKIILDVDDLDQNYIPEFLIA